MSTTRSAYVEIEADEAEDCECASTITKSVMFTITLMGPVCFVVIGADNFGSCSAQPAIPICLIVIGSSSFFGLGLNLIQMLFYMDFERTLFGKILLPLINVTIIISIITGAIFTFIMKNIDFNDVMNTKHYCNREVYNFSYYTSMIVCSALGLSLVFTCVINVRCNR